jgi:hypothetical protein
MHTEHPPAYRTPKTPAINIVHHFPQPSFPTTKHTPTLQALGSGHRVWHTCGQTRVVPLGTPYAVMHAQINLAHSCIIPSTFPAHNPPHSQHLYPQHALRSTFPFPAPSAQLPNRLSKSGMLCLHSMHNRFPTDSQHALSAQQIPSRFLACSVCAAESQQIPSRFPCLRSRFAPCCVCMCSAQSCTTCSHHSGIGGSHSASFPPPSAYRTPARIQNTQDTSHQHRAHAAYCSAQRSRAQPLTMDVY